MRMEPDAQGRFIQGNSMNQEHLRFRANWNLVSWHGPSTGKSDQQISRKSVLEKLNSFQRAHNSTRGLTPGLIDPSKPDSRKNRIPLPKRKLLGRRLAHLKGKGAKTSKRKAEELSEDERSVVMESQRRQRTKKAFSTAVRPQSTRRLPQHPAATWQVPEEYAPESEPEGPRRAQIDWNPEGLPLLSDSREDLPPRRRNATARGLRGTNVASDGGERPTTTATAAPGRGRWSQRQVTAPWDPPAALSTPTVRPRMTGEAQRGTYAEGIRNLSTYQPTNRQGLLYGPFHPTSAYPAASEYESVDPRASHHARTNAWLRSQQAYQDPYNIHANYQSATQRPFQPQLPPYTSMMPSPGEQLPQPVGPQARSEPMHASQTPMQTHYPTQAVHNQQAASRYGAPATDRSHAAMQRPSTLMPLHGPHRRKARTQQAGFSLPINHATFGSRQGEDENLNASIAQSSGVQPLTSQAAARSPGIPAGISPPLDIRQIPREPADARVALAEQRARVRTHWRVVSNTQATGHEESPRQRIQPSELRVQPRQRDQSDGPASPDEGRPWSGLKNPEMWGEEDAEGETDDEAESM